MAFDYDTSNTGVFFRIGKFIKYINSRLATATTTLPAELKAIVDPYEAADMTGQIDGVYNSFDEMQQAVTNERNTLAGYIDATLLDRDTVLEQLAVTNANLDEVLPALIRQMGIDSESVDASTVTLGSVTAASGNTGNGTILITKVLDGYNAPLDGGPAIVQYAGLNSELCVGSETMTLDCTADNDRDGLPEGSEAFTWKGGIADVVLGWQTEGSGDGPSLTAAGGVSLLSNGTFEDFTDDEPNGWDVIAGTVATHILQTTAEQYRGDSALHFDGDNTQASIKISQTIPQGQMQSRRGYFVSVRLKASAASGTGSFTLMFEGTGYTASSSEKVAISAGAMPTSYTLYSFFVCTPATLPDDWALTINNAGTPGASSNVYVDDVFVVPAVYHGGVAAAVIPGSTPFAVSDRFTFTVANDAAGTIQEFFRKWYKVQLPSNGAGSETILDSLAT